MNAFTFSPLHLIQTIGLRILFCLIYNGMVLELRIVLCLIYHKMDPVSSAISRLDRKLKDRPHLVQPKYYV